MKDPLKPRDKVTQKMSRDGLIEVNETKETAERISRREQETDYTKQPEQPQDMAQQLHNQTSETAPLPPTPGIAPKHDTVTAERVMEHIGAAQTRQASKKAVRKAQEEATTSGRSSRLQFTDEELSTPELEKYIKNSDKAADRLDAARAAVPKEKVLVRSRTFDEATGKGKTRLHFEEREKPMPDLKHRKNPLSRPVQEAGVFVHNKIHEVEKDNSGVEGAHKTEELTEGGARYGARKIREGYHRHKLKPYRAAAKAEKAAARANVEFQYQKLLHDNSQIAASNPLSRYWQKQQIKKQYAKAARTGSIKTAAENTRKAAKKAAETTQKTAEFAARHWKGILLIIAVLLLFIMVSAGLSSCGAMFSGLLNGVIGTSYTSEDSDLVAVENNYAAMETELQQRIDNIERDYPGYDEYRYDLDNIGHNPHALASYLTALLQSYTPQSAQAELDRIFNLQYKLTVTEEVEIRYRTETDTWTDEDGTTHTDTYEVPYEYYILHVRLQNKTLPMVVGSLLDAEQKEIYDITLELKGNKPYLWDDIYTSGGGSYDPGSDYTIPGEALSDPAFAALILEAEKYLGWPYVWGGSSPSTSFDCSGFVCWVFTNSGVHNLPRTTAQGIYNQCTPVSAADAKAGDIIFFTGTYNSGVPVSHVGIYCGNGVMIHCGDPISYASINSSYWQSHFYAFGRLSGN